MLKAWGTARLDVPLRRLELAHRKCDLVAIAQAERLPQVDIAEQLDLIGGVPRVPSACPLLASQSGEISAERI
jgi:hypothetical protein